jgi:hypothetical protein
MEPYRGEYTNRSATMSDSTIALLTGLFGVILGTALFAAALGGAWVLGTRYRGRPSQSQLSNGDTANPGDVAQLAGIVRTLHTVTLELERVADVQRYTALALAELHANQLGASGNQLPGNPSRVITPH